MFEGYDVGDEARLSVAFTNAAAGTAVDPSAVALRVRAPDGTVTTYTYALAEVTRDSAGAYHRDIALTASGTWHWRWDGTGTNAASVEGGFQVRASNFA
jgi:uncharacterized protein YfaS (alpha-2-macroglobulin family)